MAKPITLAKPPTNLSPPPLEQGDLLTRAEFERRYQAMPHVKKAELIEGEVYIPSPVRLDQHAEPHAVLNGWLFTYRVYTPGVRLGDNVTIRLDLDNEPQPDVALLIEPGCGGQAAISDDDYIEGAPELVAEIAASSVSIDLNKKLHVYRRNQVREYLVWRVQDQAIDWFMLHEGRYDPLPKVGEIYQSQVFPGLWLDDQAMLRGDLLQVLKVLQQGIASPEHATFVTRMEQARNSGR